MYQLRFRQVHLDFHTSPDIPGIGERFNKKQWQERLKAAHVDSITCFSLCHHGMSYHPTRVGMMHPNLKFNLLRAQMDACKEIDVNVPVYLTAGVNNYAAENHPEWREINAEGTYAGWVASPIRPGFRTLCFNTSYLDYLCDHIVETVKMFPEADGIFLDIIAQAPCCCPACMKSMVRDGFDPQKEEDRKAHARKVLLNYYKRTFEAVRSVDSSMPIFHNSGNLTIGDHEILPYFSHLELESLPTGGWGYDHYPMSAAYSRNLGLDFLGMTGKFHRAWGEFGGFKHPNALRYECAAMLAHNSKCSIGDQMHPDGELDQTTYELIGAAYQEVEQKEPWCRNAHSLAEIAILAEADTETGNVGASRLLLEQHLPFDLVDATMDFSRYRVILAANEKEISSETAEKLRAYLAAGGKLVLCSDSILKPGTCEPWFEFGAEFGETSPSNPDYVRMKEVFAGNFKTPFLMQLPSRRMKVTTALSLAEIYDSYFNRTVRHFCSHQHTPNKPEASGYDAAAISGNILYFAHPVFTLYRSTGAVMHKQLFAQALSAFLGDQAQVVTGNLPSTGRVTLMRQENEKRTICHVLYAPTILRGGELPLENEQRNLSTTEIIEDLIPLHDVALTVKVSEPVRKVTLQPENREIPFDYAAGKVSFTIPEFTCHTMAVLE